MKNKLFTALYCICLVLFMLTFAIGLPIYCRFLYYIQIKTLGLEQATGWSYGMIKQAYDEVLNFCTLPWVNEFSAGQLKFSESGASHFADCKVLFNLNLGVLLSSGAVLLALIILQRFKKLEILSFGRHKAYFWSGIIAVALPVLLIIIIAIAGFDNSFQAFHAIFFPGKDNWVFSASKDEIIRVMPQQFFINCAIIIAVGLIAFASALIAADLIIKYKAIGKGGVEEAK